MSENNISKEVGNTFKRLEILCLVTAIMQLINSAIALLGMLYLSMSTIGLVIGGLIEIVLIIQIFKAYKGLKAQNEVRRVIYFFILGLNGLVLAIQGFILFPAILFVCALILSIRTVAFKNRLEKQSQL